MTKQMDKPNFVIYNGTGEVIVTTPAMEAKTIDEYFTKGGRDLDDYDREESFDEAGFSIESSFNIR